MKKYNFEMKSPSKKAQKIMRRKLFLLEIKNNLSDIFSFSSLKIALPAFSFAILVIGFFNSQGLFVNNFEQKSYITQMQNKVKQTELNYYKRYAMLRNLKN